MENYIVRIYRRNAADSQQIAGMVENVEKRESTAFKSPDELMKILSMLPKDAEYKVSVD